MGRASLKSVELRLERALDHFEALATSINRVTGDPDTYGVVLEVDEKRRPVLRVQHVKEPSPEWEGLVSDCAHGMRSALDHLAYQLLIANTPGRVPRDRAKSSAFPIYTSGREFRERVQRGSRKGQPTSRSGLHKIRGVSDNARAIIERLQPYHRRKNPNARRLWELQELSNADKHRLFPLVHHAFALRHFKIVGNAPFFLGEFESVPGRIKRGAVVARWGYIAEARRMHMDVKAELITDIEFSKGRRTPYPLRGRSVIPTLHGVLRFIADEVVPPLADELGVPFNFKPGRLLDMREFPLPPPLP